MSAPNAFPLVWPDGWPRTTSRRQKGDFRVSPEQARTDLLAEVRRIGGRYPVISSNVPLRLDGTPRSGTTRERLPDPGVAVYFERGGRQLVFACDRFDAPYKNIRAISNTINAMRAIERYGASDMLERALHAFEALPPPGDWRTVLGFAQVSHGSITLADAERRYRELVKTHHPDAGGEEEHFLKIYDAIEQAREELG